MVEDLAKTCESVAQLNQKYAKCVIQDLPVHVARIVAALGEFMECVRYLNTRRSSGAILSLDSEAAVQDALFLMLRPWVTDLVWENPTDKVGGRYAIKDFISKSAKSVIEAKFIRDAPHGRSISKELHDDIETYRNHPHCRHLIFFIYDPNALIPDRASLERQICVPRAYGGVTLDCELVVKP
jgi:REase_DpnII-MboI